MAIMKWIMLAAITSCVSCSKSAEGSGHPLPKGSSSAIQITLADQKTPTVQLESFTLIQSPGNDFRDEALKILTVKRKWPLAMQSQNKAAFDSILAQDFTFKGIGEFFNRQDYIENRIQPSAWKITWVAYENVCLEFLNANLAILTYKNRIKNVHDITAAIEFERISWVDVYTRENGIWKIKSAHAIDYQLEK